ncbi:GSCOCG00006277001-RA-CDS [Cotesia congregata]|nr:GSCOCG00006277001-RA-CDS [Cotesia congregata]
MPQHPHLDTQPLSLTYLITALTHTLLTYTYIYIGVSYPATKLPCVTVARDSCRLALASSSFAVIGAALVLLCDPIKPRHTQEHLSDIFLFIYSLTPLFHFIQTRTNFSQQNLKGR